MYADGLNFNLVTRAYLVMKGNLGVGEIVVFITYFSKMMCGIWKPNQGRILLGNKEIESIEKSEIEKKIAYYPANPIIIYDTIYANATLGAENADNASVENVMKKMQLNDTIVRKENSYNMRIGNGGCTLSAGERQRLGLGRAFFSTKKIVIMDEPTAFLDEITKYQVMREVLNYHKNVLFIIISHDTDILRECDDIIRIENGKMISCKMEKNGGETGNE